MVILQFNKLIRNKWVWGAFAILVSLAFCFDDLFTTRDRPEVKEGDAGTLAGEAVPAEAFATCVSDIRGYGRQRDERSSNAEVNRRAWKLYAATKVAEKDGVYVSDERLSEAIRAMFGREGEFNFENYRNYVGGELNLTPEDFEKVLRRQMTVSSGIRQVMLATAAWASPMELDQSVSDMTDVFTVRVANFAQDKNAADAVKVDEAGLRKWYDDNLKKIALPERIKVRSVRFNAKDPAVLAKMSVTENELKDYYDAVAPDEYTTKDTNGVDKVKEFAEVRAEIEAKLRQIAAVEFFRTNLIQRAYANPAAGEDRKASRLDKIAGEESLKVVESEWFALEGGYVEGFMTRSDFVMPGAKNFVDEVAQLDPEVDDFRYCVVNSDSAVWLVERSALSPAHTPTFEEAKGRIDAAALRDAKAAAFKAEVEAIAAKGADAVLATANVSTNLQFSVSDMQYGMFPDQYAVAHAAVQLKKGEVSAFTPTGAGKAVLVVCIDRKGGDAAKSIIMRPQTRDRLSGEQLRYLAGKWDDWNLERLGFTVGADSYVTETEESAD